MSLLSKLKGLFTSKTTPLKDTGALTGLPGAITYSYSQHINTHYQLLQAQQLNQISGIHSIYHGWSLENLKEQNLDPRTLKILEITHKIYNTQDQLENVRKLDNFVSKECFNSKFDDFINS